jgi:hypothetical protein
MTQYLVAIYRPENYDPAVSEDEAMGREIDALNHEMIAAGVRVFVGGLQPESSARSLRLQPAGKVLITDGPYADTKEHIGGFWVLQAADLDEALAWGRKAAVAYRASGRGVSVLAARRKQLSGLDAAQIEGRHQSSVAQTTLCETARSEDRLQHNPAVRDERHEETQHAA